MSRLLELLRRRPDRGPTYHDKEREYEDKDNRIREAENALSDQERRIVQLEQEAALYHRRRPNGR